MTRKASRKTAIGYVRVSRLNGRSGDSYISEDVQRDEIARVAAAKGLTIVGWYSDVDESGKKWDRPGFQAALTDVENGDAGAIVVAKMSRFARNVMNAEIGLRKIEKAGGHLVAGDLEIDTTTPSGRMMRTIFEAVHQWELENKTEEWKEARGRAIARGVWARKAPLGYRRNKAKALEVDPDVAPLVVELFERRRVGASGTELLAWWRDAGGPDVTRSGLMTMLRNRAYLGEQVETTEFVVPNAHEALVTPELFASVQRTPSLRKQRKQGSLLAGLIRCSVCGQAMTAVHSTRVPSYRHQRAGNFADLKCPHRHSIAQSLADRVVTEALFDWAARYTHAASGESAIDDQLGEALVVLEQAEAELSAFATATSASSRPDLFMLGMEQREAAVESAQARVDELRAAGDVEAVRFDAIESWDELELDDRRRLLATAIDHVDCAPAASRLGTVSDDVRLAAARDRLSIVFKS